MTTIAATPEHAGIVRRTRMRMRFRVMRWICNRAGWIANHLEDVAYQLGRLECAAARAAAGENRAGLAAEEYAINAWRAEVKRGHLCPDDASPAFATGAYRQPARPADDAPEAVWSAYRKTPAVYTPFMTCCACDQQWKFPAQTSDMATAVLMAENRA